MLNRNILILIVLFVVSCGKDAGKYNENYIGEWRSSMFTKGEQNGLRQNILIVDSKNDRWGFDCNTAGENCKDELTGKVRINQERNKLYLVKLKGGSVHLTIEKEPYVNQNGVWTCLLDGVELYRE
jgi:hypothetical protein